MELRERNGIVGLRVQRNRHAGQDGENAADKDREEIIDARAAPAQAVQALHLEGKRDEHGDDRQAVDVLPDGRLALRHGHELRERGLEPDVIRQQKRRGRRAQVGDHVQEHEQPVVAPQHAARASRAELTAIRNSRSNRSVENASACRRIAAESNASGLKDVIAAANASTDASSTSTPVTPGMTVSSAPPRPSAMTGRPQAMASTGAIPKSSSPGSRTAPAAR